MSSLAHALLMQIRRLGVRAVLIAEDWDRSERVPQANQADI